MTRRFHRGLLLGISLVALAAVVGADRAGAQDLTNPAGTTIAPGLIRVDTGDTFDNVFNFGIIAGTGAGGPGIEVAGSGQVLGDVQNAETGIIALTSSSGTGILVSGTNVAIGGDVENLGLIQLDLFQATNASGIRVTGTGTVEGDVANREGASLLVLASVFQTWYGAGFDLTAPGGIARGITVTGAVTGIDDIVNSGAIQVSALASLNIRASDSTYANAAGAIVDPVYAVGIEATGAPIAGALVNDGTIDVRALGHMSAQAHATGISAEVAIGTRNVDMTVTAIGIDSDLDGLPGGLHNSGRIDVAATAESIYVGVAHATSGDAAAGAAGVTIAQRVSANAYGIHADLETVAMGPVSNDGRIDVTAVARKVMDLSAEADVGDARAGIDAGAAGFDLSAIAFARGFSLTNSKSNDTIAGGVDIDRRIDVTASAALDLDLAAVGPGAATAYLGEAGGGAAKLFAQASARGVNLEFVSVIDGDFDSDAQIDVVASASLGVALQAEAGTGDAQAVIRGYFTFLSIGNQVSASGLRFVASKLNGDVINTGRIDTVAHSGVVVDLVAESEGRDAYASIDGQSPRIGGLAQATGIAALPGAFLSGPVVDDFRNEGRIRAIAEASLTVSLEARGDGKAFAYIEANQSNIGIGQGASAIGILASFFGTSASLGGDFRNSGDVTVGAYSLNRVDLIAEADAAYAYLVGHTDITIAASVYAFGIDAVMGQVAGDVDNSGDIDVDAVAAVLVALSADGGGLGSAWMYASSIELLAACGICSGPTPVVGLAVRALEVGGDVLNSGDVAVAATAYVGLFVAAHAESGEAKAVVTARGPIVISAPAYAIGAGFGIDDALGDLTNSGDIDVSAAGVVVLGISAVGGGGNAHALLASSSAYVALAGEAVATGLAVAGRSGPRMSLDGDFGNSGDIAVAATGLVSAVLAAGSPGGTAEAKVGGNIVRMTAAAEAVGIDIGASDIGGVANSGDVTAIALAGGALGLSVTAGDTAFARFRTVRGVFGSAAAVATGLYVAAERIDGTLDNSGDILAAAFADLTVAAVAAGNSAYAEINQLTSAQTMVAHAHAHGLVARASAASSAFGGIANSGHIDALAHAGLLIALSAAATAGEAEIFATRRSGSGGATRAAAASATGLTQPGGDIVGAFGNTGPIDAAASASLTLYAHAQADGGPAKIAMFDFNQVFTADADAAGVRVTGTGDVGGGFTNSGALDAYAHAGVVADLSAVADGGKASAVLVGFFTLWLSASADAVGLDATLGDIGVSFTNSGAVQALASATVDAGFQAHAHDGSAFAAMYGSLGLNGMSATAYASARGIAITAWQVDGLVSNTGAVTVGALAGVDMEFIAEATGTVGRAEARPYADADIDVTAAASAYGLVVAVGASDGIVNSGALVVGASADLHLLVSAAASAGDANAELYGRTAGVHILGHAAARGLVASPTGAGTPSLTNDGDITAQAVAQVDVALRAESVNGVEHANIHSTQGAVAIVASAYAYGIEARFGSLTAGFGNSGDIVADASATLRIGFDAGDTATIAATSTDVRAVATAYGIMLAGSSIGDHLTNSGDVVARAFASAYAEGLDTRLDADAVAIATALFVGKSGTIEGDLVNRAGLMAIAEARIGGSSTGLGYAAAVGIALRMNVTGDLVNSGTIAASAYGSNAAAFGIRIIGHAIDGSIKNTGVIAAFVNGPSDNRPYAIDAGQATGATTVEQLDGVIIGDVDFSNAFADVLEFSGGEIHGDLFGHGGDRLLAYAGVSDVLNFSGNVNSFATIDVNFPSATAGTPGVELRLGGTVTNTGLLSVNAVGTLVVGSEASIAVATYRQDPLGTTAFEIAPGAAGRITAGTADLAGTLEVRAAPGLYGDHESFLIVDGGVAGGDTYDSLSFTGALLQVRDDYSVPGDVYLDVTRVGFGDVGGLTDNQHSVGEALEADYDDLVPGSDFAAVVSGLFGLTVDQYRRALDDLAGAEHAQMLKIGAGAIQSIDNALMGRLALVRGLNAQQMASVDGVGMAFAQVASTGDVDLRMDLAQAEAQQVANPGDTGVWARVFGVTASLDGDEEAPGFDADGGGVSVGVDHRISPDLVVGLYGGYAHTDADFETNANGSVDTYQVGLYGSWANGPLHVDGAVSGAWQDYEVDRTIDFLGRRASSDYDGWAFSANAQVGYDVSLGSTAVLEPMAGLSYIHLETDGFEESGADSVDLNVEDGSYDSLKSSLGVRLTAQIDMDEGMVLVPTASLAWQHEFLDANGEITASFAGSPNGTTFDIVGSDDGEDAAVIGLGVALTSDNMTAFVGYDGKVTADASSHQGTIGIRFGF